MCKWKEEKKKREMVPILTKWRKYAIIIHIL